MRSGIPDEYTGYTLSSSGVQRLVGKTIADQHKTVFIIMNNLLRSGSNVVTETEMYHALIAARASGMLRTRRNPWKVFAEVLNVHKSVIIKVDLRDPIMKMNDEMKKGGK